MTTININDGTEREHYLHIEERDDGFWYCTSGTTSDGLYFESDDIGPFATAQEAEEQARAHL